MRARKCNEVAIPRVPEVKRSELLPIVRMHKFGDMCGTRNGLPLSRFRNLQGRCCTITIWLLQVGVVTPRGSREEVQRGGDTGGPRGKEGRTLPIVRICIISAICAEPVTGCHYIKGGKVGADEAAGVTAL